MTQFLAKYWLDIVVFLIVSGGLLWMFKHANRKAVDSIILDIVLKLDNKYDATPDERFQIVYDHLPRVIKLLYSLQDLRKIVDELLEDVEQRLKEETL